MTTKKHTAGFQTLALSSIQESTTNPRRTFDESKLAELADLCPGTKCLFRSADHFVADEEGSRMETGGSPS